MKRPDDALTRLKVTAALARGQVMDDESAAFMRDLNELLNWLAHLEKPSETPET